MKINVVVVETPLLNLHCQGTILLNGAFFLQQFCNWSSNNWILLYFSRNTYTARCNLITFNQVFFFDNTCYLLENYLSTLHTSKLSFFIKRMADSGSPWTSPYGPSTRQRALLQWEENGKTLPIHFEWGDVTLCRTALWFRRVALPPLLASKVEKSKTFQASTEAQANQIICQYNL